MKLYKVLIGQNVLAGSAKEIVAVLKTKSCRTEWTLASYMRHTAARNIKWNTKKIRVNSYDNFIKDMHENKHLEILATIAP